MDSNIHRTSGESAGIVATALRVEAEGRGRVPPADLFFILFLRQGLNISQNIKNVMLLLLLFFITFSSCCIKVKRLFHESYAPVICNHGPRPVGRARDSRANVLFFFTFTLNSMNKIYQGKHGSAM